VDKTGEQFSPMKGSKRVLPIGHLLGDADSELLTRGLNEGH
jgi:hypothetical protein